MCLDDGMLDEKDQERFSSFCQLIRSIYGVKFQRLNQQLKDNFNPIDPDTNLIVYRPDGDIVAEAENEKEFLHHFEYLLEKANFDRLDKDALQKAFVSSALIKLKIEVEFDDYDIMRFYYRGMRSTEETVTNFRFFEKTISYDVFGRVVLLIKFKDKSHFEKKEIDLENLNFIPGKMYIFYYKDVPKVDLEAFFPNVKIRMTPKDKVLFLFPTLWAGVGAVIKILPNLTLILGVVIFYAGMKTYATKLGVNAETVKTSFIPLIATTASILVVLGGFALEQYLSYKNKWVKFLKRITDSLFYRLISINGSVFRTLIDEAVEEESKEAILVYYHLLISDGAGTVESLDKNIETWFKEKFDAEIDFEIKDALDKLENLVTVNADNRRQSVLMPSDDGTFSVLPPETALHVMRTMWRDFF